MNHYLLGTGERRKLFSGMQVSAGRDEPLEGKTGRCSGMECLLQYIKMYTNSFYFYIPGGKKMISGVSASLSGLLAYGTRLANNGNNIANMNTEGFKKGRVLLSDVQPQGVRARHEKVNTPGPQVMEQAGNTAEMIEQSNVDLSEELPEMMVNQHAFSANLKTLQAADEMTRSLLDIKA